MSRVDVIVPCYNYGRFLRECVESVLSQPVDVRVLIIDDASTDETPEVAAALAAEDPRVEFRRHTVNRGHIATYNEGLEWISGDYALLISADDLLVSGALLRACEFMDEHPEVGFVYGPHIHWRTDKPRPVCQSSCKEIQSRVIPGLAYIETVCEKGNPIASPEVVVRTKLQKELGGYRHDLPHWGDTEMWLRFAAHAPVGYINAYQAYRREHGNNMYLQGDVMNKQYLGLRDFEQQIAVFRYLFDYHAHRIQDAERLRSLASCRISREAVYAASKSFDRRNLDYCNKYMEIATSMNPLISEYRPYLRLRFKMRLGLRLWDLLRPFWKRLNQFRVKPDDVCWPST